ncbi:MAG: heavy metal translocating P-type ATPase [Chryseolinea sp.]
MKTKKEIFPVLEMTCTACAVSVESMIRSVTGVSGVNVNYANQSALVEYDPAIADREDLQKAVRSIGYDLVVDVEDPQAVKEAAQQKYFEAVKQRAIWSAVLATPVFIIGMFFNEMPYANYISFILSAPVVFYLGRTFFINAWRLIRHGMANMDTLVALSTGIAFLFSAFNTFYPEFWHARGVHAHVYYEAAAVVVAFISIGKFLEERVKSKTSSAIKKLMGLQPANVHLIVDGLERETPLSSVVVGNIIIVRPGERVPLDGRLISGSSFIDESMISGEPMPVEKNFGDKVFAGSMNQKGSFQFEVEKIAADTVLAHIIRMVQEAQGSKAPVQKLVDKIAGIFVPVVVSIAIVTFIIWILFGGENGLTHAILGSITVLVIACPCALGLATPTAIMVGVGKGAENNILIKDAESLELAHRVDTIILDKTGTITEGRPAVTDLLWMEPAFELKYAAILYAIEIQSEHPLGTAVVNLLKANGAQAAVTTDFETITGKGVRAKANGETFYIGNKRFIEENDLRIADTLQKQVGKLQREAKTVVYFAGESQVLAIIAIADKVKAESKEAIDSMLNAGKMVYMLTGDNQHTAAAIAAKVGIANFNSEMMPSDKAAFVKELQSQGKIVAMVGDGINDAPALVQADLSMAMGKGSDIAMDVAKITLITSDLRSIPKALKLSSRTVRGIHQNLFWAFIYNIIGIPIAAGILYPLNGFLLDPMIAGAAMAMSSVSVIGNSLRLRHGVI